MGDAQSRWKRTSTDFYECSTTRSPTMSARMQDPRGVDFPVFKKPLSVCTPTKAPMKRPTKASTDLSRHESVQSSGRGSPVLFSPVLFVGHNSISMTATKAPPPPEARVFQGDRCHIKVSNQKHLSKSNWLEIQNSSAMQFLGKEIAHGIPRWGGCSLGNFKIKGQCGGEVEVHNFMLEQVFFSYG